MSLTAEEWRENNGRLMWVVYNRARIEEAAGVSVPRRTADVAEWLTPQRRSAVTRALEGPDEEEGEDESEAGPTEETDDG